MSSHGAVRALMDRLAALTLIALLAGPSVAPYRPDLARARDASSTADTGMNAPPGPTTSAALSAAPMGPAAPSFVTARVVVAFESLTGGRPPDRALRPAVAVKPAPTILRI